METENAQIIVRILAGETGAYRILVERFQQPIFRFVRNLIHDEHEAEDITQEVFVSAFRHLRSYDDKQAALLTWFFSIARNRCLNYLKRKRPVIHGEELQNTTQDSTASDTIREEFWREINAAFGALPPEQKTAFVLAEIEELSYAEIAVIEQTTLGTVKSRIHRAKQRLRSILEPNRKEL